MRAAQVVVWQLSDGKRGHERQCEGLVEALAARLPLDHRMLAAERSAPWRFAHYLSGQVPGAMALPAPDLIVGAGRGCQWPLLTARRTYGGRAVYLMRPGLPVSWFDLCIIPRHDRPPASANVIVSDGPLNSMVAASVRDPGLGVFLLGGSSSHHAWDTEAILAQVDSVLAARPGIRWYASDSRRSPPALERALRARGDVEFVSHRECAADWLPTMLARARHAWISADSVAMIYEALSAGAEVGVLAVPARSPDRITGVATDLRARGLVITVEDLGKPRFVSKRPAPLDEARRCAELILRRWPELAAPAPVT